MLALLAEESERCKGCGHPLDVCMDPATEYEWVADQHICQACLVLEMAQDNAAEGSKQRGLKLRVSRS